MQIEVERERAPQNFAKPEGMSDADYANLKKQMDGIFNAAIGVAALQKKDFPTATKSSLRDDR